MRTRIKMEWTQCCGYLIVLYLQQAVFITAGTHNLPEQLTAIRTERRSFTSLNYPGHYPNDSEYVWIIRTKFEGDVVQIITVDSHLESKIGSDKCPFDYIRVFDGPGLESPVLEEWCGTSQPSVVSTGQVLTVLFRSDSSHSQAGFRIEYISTKAGSTVVNPPSGTDISLMGMVGYMVLVLAFLSIAMFVLRFALTKTKFCKGLGGQRGSSLFRMRRNRSNNAPGQTRGGGGTDVYMIPVEPPPYQATDLSQLPPPYAEINPAFEQLDYDSPNPETHPGCLEGNRSHHEPVGGLAPENVSNNTSLISSIGAHNDSLPPSYDSILGGDVNGLGSTPDVNVDGNSVIHEHSNS